MMDMTYTRAIKNAAHLIALGQTDVYLYSENKEDFPYNKVSRVESGSTHRLSGPASVRLFAEEAGLTFSISIDFEGRDAEGRGISLFDRDRLRGLMMKLPDAARESFGEMLAREVLPGLAKRSAELRDAMNSQIDSEDCVRGLIAFAGQSA